MLKKKHLLVMIQKTYYDPNLRAVALSAVIEEEPGKTFHYNTHNYLLLGIILERATGMPVAKYMEERLWKPLGMEAPASWSLDSEASGFEKLESVVGNNNNNHHFYAAGNFGQFIYIVPEEKLVIVRHGYDFGQVNWINLFESIASATA